MKKKIDELKIRTIFSSILTLAPILIGLGIWNRIPNSLLPNSTITTNIDTPIYKIILVFGIPVLLFVLNLICLTITYKDNHNNNQNKKVLNSLFYICPAISIISSIFFYNGVLGNSFNTTRIMPSILGVMFIFFGNNLPKAKPNATYGIKTYWALKNNENWFKTHRVGGYTFVIGGIIMLFLPAIPLNLITQIMVAIILLCVIIPILYSYFYHKKQIKAGKYTNDGALPPKYNNKQKFKIFVVMLIVLGAILAIMSTGNVDTRLESDSIHVNASYYTDFNIDYDNIKAVTLRESKSIGVRDLGFGSFKLSLGTFSNDEFGSHTCYVYNHTDNVIIIETANDIIELNAKNEDDTEILYEEIKSRIE